MENEDIKKSGIWEKKKKTWVQRRNRGYIFKRLNHHVEDICFWKKTIGIKKYKNLVTVQGKKDLTIGGDLRCVLTLCILINANISTQ